MYISGKLRKTTGAGFHAKARIWAGVGVWAWKKIEENMEVLLPQIKVLTNLFLPLKKRLQQVRKLAIWLNLFQKYL